MAESGCQIVRRGSALVAFVVVTHVTGVAWAGVQECVDAHGVGQARRDEADFLGACAAFRTCASTECPEPIRADCATLLTQTENQLPTVVVTAEDATGADVTNASVEVDGQEFLGTLTGRATPINPGKHTFIFRAPDGSSTQATALILEGIKGRVIHGRFAASGASSDKVEVSVLGSRGTSHVPESEVDAPSKTLAYVLTGAGVVSLATFGYFALSGRSRQSELEDSCKPNCTTEQAKGVSTKYLIADISLVLGIGLVGAGTYVWLTVPGSSRVGTHLPTLGLTGQF